MYLKTVLWVTVLCKNLRHAPVCEVQKKKKKKIKVRFVCFVLCARTQDTTSHVVFFYFALFFFFFNPVTKPFCFLLVFRRHTCCIKHCLFFIKWAVAKCKTQTSLSCLLKLIVAAQGKVSGSRRGLLTSPPVQCWVWFFPLLFLFGPRHSSSGWGSLPISHLFF